MLAARIAVEGMVDELINAHADINALDEHGKSALHWAAAVNNVDAVTSLLRAGCNKDAQTEREETPLFLAAKEGSHEAVRTLLDYHANREITDHLDRYSSILSPFPQFTCLVLVLWSYLHHNQNFDVIITLIMTSKFDYDAESRGLFKLRN